MVSQRLITSSMARVIVAAAVASMSLVLGFAPQASAADIGAQLTQVKATLTGKTDPVAGWDESYDLTFDAAVPESANAGDSWTVGLPPQVTNWPAGFAIANPDNPDEKWLNVSISGGVATFTLTDAGAAVPNLKVTSKFGGTLAKTVAPGHHDLTVTQGGATLTTFGIDVKAPPTEDASQTSWKQMWFNDQSDQCRTRTTSCLGVGMTIKAGSHGTVTITETAQANWTINCAENPWALIRDYSTSPKTETGATSRLTVKSCSDTSLVIEADTKGLTDRQNLYLGFALSARAPGGTGPVTYNNTASMAIDNQTEDLPASIDSSYAGGMASGAHILIKKTDAAGNDANTAADAVLLPDGSTGLSFTIVNNGTQALTKVEVTDALISGTGTTSDLSCTFPDGSRGTTWAGPFASGANFTCTARLSGVAGDHANTARVTALGEALTEVKDEDPFHATTPVTTVPAIKIVKGDADGNTADRPDASVELVDGKADLKFTVTNTGDEPLVDIEVTDKAQGGKVTGLSCTFPDDSTGTKWAGPFEVGASFDCTAKLTGVTTTHVDTATVSGSGEITGTPVTSENPYYGHVSQVLPPESPAAPEEPKAGAPSQLGVLPDTGAPEGLEWAILLGVIVLIGGVGLLFSERGKP